MKPAVTVGVVEFLAVAAYVVLFTYIWRAIAARYSETSTGRAMAAVYS